MTKRVIKKETPPPAPEEKKEEPLLKRNCPFFQRCLEKKCWECK